MTDGILGHITTNTHGPTLPWDRRISRDTWEYWMVIAWEPPGSPRRCFARWYVAARYHGR